MRLHLILPAMCEEGRWERRVRWVEGGGREMGGEREE